MKTEITITAAGCALLMLAGGAEAQQAPTNAATTASPTAEGTPSEEGEPTTVVVTGIRRGIEDAIALKRESSSIVEAVSAEDIGKLPDTSIAESISRLPGLTSQRAEGRASAISLRGTDPGFTTALLNGREQVSTGDNRSIEFDQYPSELLSAVVVYKTPDAQLVGQGLAGTIDLRTTRPLDVSKRAVVFNIRGERNSNNDLGADSKDDGYRVSFSYIDQFMDNKLGVTFGFAHLDSPLATEGAGTYEPWHANGTPNAGALNPTGVRNQGVSPTDFVTDGIKVRTDMGTNVRDGAMASLQFKPNDAFSSIFDLYYTKRRQKDNARSIEANLSGYPSTGSALPPGSLFGFSNPTIVDNTVIGGTLNNVVPLSRNFLFRTKDKIFATGWNNSWTDEVWTFTGDLSYSKATRDEVQFETNAQLVPVNILDTGTFALTSDHMPVLHFNSNYADPATMQVGPTIYGAGYTKIPHVTDELKSVRFDVGRTLGGWFSSGLVGVNYADREKDKDQPEANLRTLGNGYFQIAPENLLAPTNLSYAGVGNSLAWDVSKVLAAYYQPIVYGTPDQPGFDYLIGKNWQVNEKVTTGFVKANLDHDLSSSVTLKGNLGIQLVRTDQSSDALSKDDASGIVAPLSLGKKYTDVLPAINLAFVLPERQTVRFGAARELARARMDQLKASSEFNYASIGGGTQGPSGSGGNPLLDPWRANALDLSYEKYFGTNAYVSLAGFYKKLKTYIFNQANGNYDFSDFVAPSDWM